MTTTNTYLLSSELLSDKENVGCVSLKDLVYHEDLVSMVQINFMIDLDFLTGHMHPTVIANQIPILVIHGLRESAPSLREQAKQYPNVKVATPFMRDKFGTHHTKAMFLFFRDGQTGLETAQIVIMTANMVEADWKLMTQGVYRTPRCPLKQPPITTTASMTTMTTATTINYTTSSLSSSRASNFETYLLKYLQAYRLPVLLPILSKLQRFDWSSCKAILVGSVPGYHREDTFADWGLERLASLLRKHLRLPKTSTHHHQVILQCSSMPHSPERWFKKDVCEAMSESKGGGFLLPPSSRSPKICVVYPTLNTASNSLTGRDLSGGFLRFDPSSYEKNHRWLDPYLYDWKSERAGRQCLMPHIKTYTRVYQRRTAAADKSSHDSTSTSTSSSPFYVAWHLLTSANLSRAAWGEYQKNKTQLYVKSFELGVLFFPELWEDEGEKEVQMVPAWQDDIERLVNGSNNSSGSGITTTEQDEHNDNKDDDDTELKKIFVRLPYDLPLVRHPGPKQCFTRLVES